MKKSLLLVFAMACTPVLRAEDKPADTVKAAVKKLGESSYSWTTSNTAPAGGNGNRFAMSSEGKTEKDGAISLKTTFGDRTTEGVIKGGKVALKTEDGWKSGEELAAAGPGGDGSGGGGGGGRRGGGGMMARMLENYKSPAVEAAALAEGIKELKKDGDVITGDLTEEAAKTRMTMGGRGRGGNGGGNAPAITDAKGSAKFWVKDGVLSKVEVTVSGKRERDGNTVDINRTTTTEIKDVGTTKVEVPAEATEKLKGGKPAEAKPAETKPEEKKAETK